MNIHPGSIVLTAGLLLAAGCANNTRNQSGVGNTDRRSLVAGIMLAEGGTTAAPPKVIVSSYALSGGSFTQKEALVSYGSGGLPEGSGDDYRVELVDANDRILQTYSVGDPRKFVVERQGIVENATGVLTVRLRFDPASSKIRIRNASSTVVAETDVRSLLAEFCRRAQGDPDCREK